MNRSRTEMAQLLPEPINWTSLGTWAISVTGLLIAFFGFTNKHFKDKAAERDAYAAAQKQEKQDFITSVVKTAMESCLLEFKTDFHEFRTNTEKQMTKFNDTVTSIYRDMKK